MLIDFTVGNFRSIKNPVTLSMIEHTGSGTSRQGTGKRHIKPDVEIAQSIPVEGRGFALLPVVGIFGANASGKSNLVRALDELLTLIAHGRDDQRDLLDAITPFKLDSTSSTAPTLFKLRIARQGSIFSYTLEVDQRRVVSERLDILPPPPKRTRLLFDRQWNSDSGSYQWKNGTEFAGPHLQLQPRLNEALPYLTLFIRQVDADILTPLVQWIQRRFGGISLGQERFESIVAADIIHSHGGRESLVPFLCKFDTGIADLEIEEVAADNERKRYRVYAVHHSPEGRVRWPFSEESAGTQRLFGISYKVVGTLAAGGLLVMDELGSNIHPAITRRLIRMFQNPELNRGHGQLVFTSHDNTLKRNQLLRRDQIWFTDKSGDGSTDLYPLSDFKVRNDVAIDRAYLDGRFGAVPVLPDESDMLPFEEIDT